MDRNSRLVAIFLAAFLLQTPWLTPAAAQSAAASAAAWRDPEYQALFRRMFANPRDMDATFRFAEVAERLGDYEAAIGALERVLMFNPNLPQVKVKLGSLYARIGGREMARTYFSQAIATAGAPPEVVAAAQQLLANPDAGPYTKGFYLYAYGGWRYQSNASAGPNSSLIRSGGDIVNLDNQFGKQADWNHFIQVATGYNYDLAPGITVEAGFFGYYAKQFKLDQFDLGLAEVQVGPRFALPWLFSEGSVKVYGIGTASWLADSPYYRGPGAGVSARFSIPNLFWLEPVYEWRERDFRNSELYPTVAEQSGNLQIAALNANGIAMGTAWFARVSGAWNRSDQDTSEFHSYDRWTADFGFSVPLGRWWGSQYESVLTPLVGYSKTDYAQANPVIDPNIVRSDSEWHVGAALDVPVYDRWGVRTLVRYSETSSNLPNFDTKNFAVSVGPTYRY